MTKLLLISTVVFGLTVIPVFGQTSYKTSKTVFIGTWYYNGVGGVSDSKGIDSNFVTKYKNSPIKTGDTLLFIDTVTLIVNRTNKYNYKIESKLSDFEANDSKFWQTFLIIDDAKYFVHFAFGYIEIQNTIDNHRWYGRFVKEGASDCVQAPRLYLSAPLDKLIFRETSLKQTKKIVGKPSNIQTSRFSKHRHARSEELYYSEIKATLRFDHETKILYNIELDSASTVAINGHIKVGVSDTNIVLKTFGTPIQVDRQSFYLCFSYKLVPYEVDFYFDKSGYLCKVYLFKNISCTNSLTTITPDSVRGKYIREFPKLTVEIKFKKNGKYLVTSKGAGYGDGMCIWEKGTWKVSNDTIICVEHAHKHLFPGIAVMSHPPLPISARTWVMVMKEGKLYLVDSGIRTEEPFIRHVK